MILGVYTALVITLLCFMLIRFAIVYWKTDSEGVSILMIVFDILIIILIIDIMQKIETLI